MVVRRRKTTRKKKSKGKYDYKKIASQTKGQVKDSSERKGISGSNIFKAGQEITFFKPAADEDHTIDIVPFIAGSNIAIDMKTGEPLVEEGDWAYTYEYWRHSGIGPLENETVICPERTYKTPCPICEHRRELSAEKAFDAKKMPELLSKQRNIYNIACYDTEKEEEKGAQVMDVAHFYFEKHISKLASKPVRRKRGSKLRSADPFKNFADPSDGGVSVEFSIEGAKTKNDFDTWMGHQLIERNYNIDAALMDAALQLDQVVEVLSYEELYKIYYDEDYEGDEGRDERGRGAPEEEEEGEEEPEPDDTDELEDMDRRELKALLKEEEIDFTVYKQTEDDEIRGVIREARGDEEREDEPEEEPEEEEGKQTRRRRKPTGESKRQKCPAGGNFGDDYEEFDDCDDCDIWERCEKAANKE